MKFRPICIVDKIQVCKNIDIEICIDTGSKTLSPFQRKITVSDLLKSDDVSTNKIIHLLFLTGQEQQPFRFSIEQMCCIEVRKTINNYPWLYVKSGGRNSSLKRIESLSGYFPPANNTSFPNGTLLRGELYISNIKSWWKNLKVRLRYNDTTTLFPTQFTDIPFQTDLGLWLSRSKKQESELLAILGPYLSYDLSLLHLKESDFERIKLFISHGWKLFIPKEPGSHTSVYLRSAKSGIEWFSSEDKVANEDVIEKILEAYLHNRNYMECGESICLFSKKQIGTLSPEAVTEVLLPNIDAERLYSPLPALTDNELSKIDECIVKNVNAELKPYQLEGVLWLVQMQKKGLGCLLADDMGLGKTLQVLTFLTLLEKKNEKHLVVCPASLTANWENEIKKFTPQLSSVIEIVSYETVRMHTDKFSHNFYNTVIIDEGQMVKNDNTQRHKAISELKRKQTIILSGTPIENSVDEIWAQFKLLIPETENIFNKIKKLDIHGDTKKWVELSKLFLSPFILRRTKKEVLKNLPLKTEENIFLEPSTEESAIYKSIKDTFIKAIETGVSGRINSIALEGLLRLRQSCVSLNLLPKTLTHKGYIRSTKLEFATNMIREFINEGHKVLVFSQFTSALDELNDRLVEDSIYPLLLTGKTRNRQILVDSFQHNDEKKLFLISLKAGGTGLNLTAADRIILLDDWWNPAVESQAFARAHRIGQRSIVEVYRLIYRNTIEEKMLELHKSKKEMLDLFNVMNTKLSVDEIKKLLD